MSTDRRIRKAWRGFRKYTLELYDRPSAPLELKIRMLRVDALEIMLYDCVTWSPRACHYDTLRPAHYRFLSRCFGWRKHNRVDHPVSYLDKFIKTASEREHRGDFTQEADLVRGIVARMEDTRLPKCVMFGELVGSVACVGGEEKEWMGCFLDDLSELSVSTPTSGRLQSRTAGNVAGRRNKGRNISWRNGSLQRKPGLDYGMQLYARTRRGGPRRG